MKTEHARRIKFLGCPVDCITSYELLEEIKVGILKNDSPKVIQFINANKVSMVRRDLSFGSILKRTDYVLADGKPMLPMAALLGLSIPERIDGIGLMQKLLRLAHNEKFTIYLLGARQDIVEKCVKKICKDYPGLTVVGFRNGYFSEDEFPDIAAEIRATSPDFLFLGIGSPTKERLADQWKEELGARVIQGVGGSFDVMAGLVKRAPAWMQSAGIEWLHRVIQEPRRMFWRYLITNGSCLWVFFNEFGIRWIYGSWTIYACLHTNYQFTSRDSAKVQCKDDTFDKVTIRLGWARSIFKVISIPAASSISRLSITQRVKGKFYPRDGKNAVYVRPPRNH